MFQCSLEDLFSISHLEKGQNSHGYFNTLVIQNKYMYYNFVDNLNYFQYLMMRLKNVNTMSDLHDGALFEQLMKPGGFLSTPDTTGLI